MSKNKVRYYPLKPKKEEGFKRAVAWFGGREFIASLKGLLVYELYGGNIDPRSWMKPNIFPDVQEKLESRDATISKDEHGCVTDKEISQKVNEYWKNKVKEQWKWKRERFEFWDKYLEKSDFGKKLKEEELEELWFDFIADTGDGQMGVYSVACLCHSDLWLEKDEIDSEIKFRPPYEKAIKKDEPNGQNRKKNKDIEAWDLTDDFNEKTLLPRGSFLFIGGDTAYHSADYATIFERFQSPFRWAFISVRKYLWENYEIKDPKAIGEDCFADQGQQQKEIRKSFVNKTELKDGTLEENTVIDFDENWDGTFGTFKEIDVKLKQNKENELTKKEIVSDMWDTEPTRPLFGIPANHDYYDALAGFNKQFRRPPYKDIEENRANDKFIGGIPLKIHSFSRVQEASYNALHLPFDWWMFGVDSENKKLDYRQRVFYREIVKRWKPRKLILATPEPTTVFGQQCADDDKTATYLAEITRRLGYQQPFLKDGKFYELPSEKNGNKNDVEIADGHCRLDLSGDIHHYARYWGPRVDGTIAENFGKNQYSADNYASLVAGGGGAFFDSTDTLIGEQEVVTKDNKTEKAEGEIPPQALYPSKKQSIDSIADKIFDLWNIKKGGYVQNIGCTIAIILFFSLTQDYSNINRLFLYYDKVLKQEGLASFIGLFTFSLTDGRNYYNNGFAVLFIFIIMCCLFFTSGWLISQLNKFLYKRDKDLKEEREEGSRLNKLLVRFLPIICGLVLYATIFLPWQSQIIKLEQDSYANTWFLLYHLIFAGILLWVAKQYSQWLKIRKIISRSSPNRTILERMRDPNIKPEGGKDYLPKVEDLDEDSNLKQQLGLLSKIKNFTSQIVHSQIKKIQRYLGQLSREYVFEYIPDTILFFLASFFIIFGIGVFGKGSLLKTSGDLFFILTFFGVFGLVAFGLGTSIGGHYHKTKGKAIFTLLGLFHATLQIFTPFVLVYYGNWGFFLLYYLVLVYFNGVAWSKKRFALLVNQGARTRGIRAKLTKWTGSQYGARLMKRSSKRLTVVWVLFGLFSLLTPLALTFIFSTDYKSINEVIKFLYLEYLNGYIISFLVYLGNLLPQSANDWLAISASLLLIKWLPIVTVLLVVGYVGYKMSRIWLSWYLGVSLVFNGHNNESGGLARIEDFKHLVRIRVKKDKLTVFVIGIDDARPNIRQLKMKLVDKFDLDYK